MPAVRLLIPFIAGIGLYISLPERMYFLSVAGIILLVSLSVIIYVNVIISVARIYKWRYASGTAIFAVMLSLGFILTFFHTSTNDPHDIDNVDKEFTRTKATYTGIISDPTVLRDKTVSVLIQLQKGAKGDTSIGMKGNVLASIVKDSLSETLQYGDKIIFSGVIMEYEEPKNPDQFDYKNYQSLHHIYQRVYLRDGEWKVTAVGQANPLLAQTYRAR
jgi:competence protein ComEC